MILGLMAALITLNQAPDRPLSAAGKALESAIMWNAAGTFITGLVSGIFFIALSQIARGVKEIWDRLYAAK